MPENMKQHTVLVVDDVSENIDILFALLKDSYKVKAAVNGPKAIQIANSNEPPDIILLDIMMPGMSGYDVCKKLKSLRKTKGIPVIFLTSVAEMDSMVKGFELGGVDYIVKPFNAVELTTRLNTHLNLKDATEILKNQNLILENMVEKRTGTLRQKNELLNAALEEKEALLKEVRSMELQLRASLSQLNKLYDKIQSIQEEERKKIAADVHDRMGQILTVIKLNLFQIKNKADAQNAKLIEKIAATIQMADDAIKAAQSITLQLRPDILDNLGFVEAVKWYSRMMQESSGIIFEPVVKGTPPALDKKSELCLYRVIQEAITNIIRHAQAKKCEIDIAGSADRLRLSIHDDGIGIETDKINGANSLGLFGIRKRIDDIHGEFHIEGSPGKGTALSISIPLPGGRDD
jgi:signal transduction histidine kinase